METANPYATPAANLDPTQKVCEACGAIIHIKAEICPKCGVRQRKPVSKAVLLLLTFFTGGIGGHKFYTGRHWQGVLYLLFFWTGIPGLIALIEFLIYAFTGSEKLQEKYEAHNTAAIVAVVAVFVGVFVLGILAAIAIPAYSDYAYRARVANALAEAAVVKNHVGEYSLAKERLPSSYADLGLARAPASQYASVSLNQGGVITVTFTQSNSTLAGKTIVLTPTIVGGVGLEWDCRGGTLSPRYRPTACR